MLGRALPALALAGLLVASHPAAAAWSTTTLGFTTWAAINSAVGDGDRDGRREVYVTDSDHAYQFRRTSSGWVRTVLDAPGLDYGLAVGDGDRDSKSEVYTGGADGEVRQCVKASTGWACAVIARPGPNGSFVRALSLGDAEPDGLRELYAAVDEASAAGSVHKLWFRDGAWHTQRLANLSTTTKAMWIGDGDRDGKRELYVGDDLGQVWRVKRAGGAWGASVIGRMPGFVWGVATGDANHDGKVEVYAVSGNGTEGTGLLARFVWTGSAWSRVHVASFAAELSDLTLLDLDGDGKRELYVTSFDGHAYRVRWTGSAWAKTDLGFNGHDALLTLVAGEGDNLAGRELYVGGTRDCSCSEDGMVVRYRP